MNTNCYKYVIAVGNTLSISKAAKELYITQPALTKFINKLEDEIGVKLFDRNSNPIKITYAGYRFIEEGKRILDIERRLKKELEEIVKMKRGKLNLGINSERGSLVLPYVIPEFQKRYPGIEINIIEGINSLIETEMLKGNLDICIETLPIETNGIDYKILDDDPIIIAVPESNPLCKKFDLSENSPNTPYLLDPKELNGQEFIILVKDQGMGRTAYQAFERHTIKPIIKTKLRKNETALRMASAGAGIVFTPVRTPLRIDLIKPMVYFTLENPVFCRKLVVSYKEGIGIGYIETQFIEVLKEIINNTECLKVPKCKVITNKKIK